MNKHGGTITARLLVARYMSILVKVRLVLVLVSLVTSISMDCISVSFA